MKTKEQVKKYIESQEWYNAFVEELRKYKRTSLDDRLDNLNRLVGHYRSLIMGAFNWSATPQGHSYWRGIEEEYQDWLNS